MLHDVDDSWTHVGTPEFVVTSPQTVREKVVDVLNGYRFNKVLPESNRLKILIVADICKMLDDTELVAPCNRHFLTRSLLGMLAQTSLDETQRIELCVSLLDLINMQFHSNDEDFQRWIMKDAVQFMEFLFDIPRALTAPRRSRPVDKSSCH